MQELTLTQPEMKPCATCGDTGGHFNDKSKHHDICPMENRIHHAIVMDRIQRQAWNVAGIPRRYYDVKFEDSLDPTTCNKSTLNLLLWIKSAFDIDMSGLVNGKRLQIDLKSAKRDFISLLLTDGDRQLKSNYAADIAKAARNKGFGVGFYTWGELLPLLSDYSRSEEQRELRNEMKALELVVIDGIQHAKGPCFDIQFASMVNTRYLSGLPTIYCCESSAKNIELHPWQDTIHDTLILRVPFEKLSLGAVKPTDEELIEQTVISLRERILAKFENDTNFTRGQLYKLFPNDTLDLVKSEFNLLIGNEIEQYKSGAFTLFRRAGTGTLSVRNLAEKSGLSKSTIQRLRAQGMSDEDILKSESDE